LSSDDAQATATSTAHVADLRFIPEMFGAPRPRPPAEAAEDEQG